MQLKEAICASAFFVERSKSMQANLCAFKKELGAEGNAIGIIKSWSTVSIILAWMQELDEKNVPLCV